MGLIYCYLSLFSEKHLLRILGASGTLLIYILNLYWLVAEVWADEVNLKEELIKRKLGVPYDGSKKSKVNWCKP